MYIYEHDTDKIQHTYLVYDKIHTQRPKKKSKLRNKTVARLRLDLLFY